MANKEIMAMMDLWSPMLRRLSLRFRVSIHEVRSIAWLEFITCKKKHAGRASFERYWLKCVEFRLVDLTRRSGDAEHGQPPQPPAVLDDPAEILQGVQEVSRLLHLAEPTPRKKNCSARHLRRLAQQARVKAEAVMLAGVVA